MAAQEKVSFQTSDGVTIRGFAFKPEGARGELPAVILLHGLGAIKEMMLDTISKRFAEELGVVTIGYDYRSFGESDTGPGQPRQEFLPHQQISDIQDAVTYVQMREDVDAGKIAIWGTSYGGAHALSVASIDRRIKAVSSQVPLVDGWLTYQRWQNHDELESLNRQFEKARMDRALGKPALTVPLVAESDADKLVMMRHEGTRLASKAFKDAAGDNTTWKNAITLRSLEAFRAYYPAAYIERISPTPLLLTVATQDNLAHTDYTLQAYERALHPKQLELVDTDHFGIYTGELFERVFKVQAEFFKKHLL